MPNVQMLACLTIEALKDTCFVGSVTNAENLLNNPKEIARFNWSFDNNKFKVYEGASEESSNNIKESQRKQDIAHGLLKKLMKCMKLDRCGERVPKRK